jgi:hypothetical protein
VLLAAVVVCPSARADGWQWVGCKTINGTTAIHGSRVDIERYNPRVTVGRSLAWAMTHRNAYGAAAYAQVGYIEQQSYDDHPYYFWEYSDKYGNDPGAQFLSPVPNGGSYDGTEDLFSVQNVSGGKIEYRINGSVVKTTSQNWTPDNAQWCSEIYYVGSTYPQIPGDTEHMVDFTRPQLYSVNDNTWHTVSPDSDHGVDNAEYGHHVLYPSASPPYFKVYDDRYSTAP